MKGARICLRSIVARISPTRASACSCSALARSSSAWARIPWPTSPRTRSRLSRARSRCDSAAASWARSWRVSSRTSTCPSLTGRPDSKLIDATTPGRSALTVTPTHRVHRPDRGEGGRPLLRPGLDRGDGLRRRLEGGRLCDRGLDLQGLDRPQDPDHPDDSHQHQPHAPAHSRLPFSTHRPVRHLRAAATRGDTPGRQEIRDDRWIGRLSPIRGSVKRRDSTPRRPAIRRADGCDRRRRAGSVIPRTLDSGRATEGSATPALTLRIPRDARPGSRFLGMTRGVPTSARSRLPSRRASCRPRTP